MTNRLLIYSYYSTPVLPDATDRRAAEKLISRVQACPGEVWIPSHTWIQGQAGKAPAVFWGSLAPVLSVKGKSAESQLPKDLVEAIASRRYSLVVIDADESFFDRVLSRNYRVEESDTSTDRHVTSLIGARQFYVPLTTREDVRR
jgi:hypothetical protein